jgi:transposase
MLRISLTDAQRRELHTLRRTDLPPVARDRLEMVLLSDAGWSAPRIAEHLGCHPHTSRAALKGFAARGVAAFSPDTPGPEPDHARRATVTGRLSELLGQDRTWTGRQLAEALRSEGIALGQRQTRRYLGLLKAGYRRTAQTVGHKQGPEKVERAEVVLAGLKKKVEAGRLKLHYLDECGFSPSLPTGYSWCLPKQRKRVKYEYPQGRRVNALATYEPFAPVPRLDARPFERTRTSEDLIAYLKELPRAGVPQVVVLDNAGIHTSKVMKAARPDLAKLGIYLYYLPAYSPELNRIEPVFKQVKHHEMPTRSFTSKADLRQAVEDGFETYRRRLRIKGDKELRLAA